MPIMNIFGWYELVLVGISSVIIYFLRVRWNSPNIMFGWSRQNADEMAISSVLFCLQVISPSRVSLYT